MVAIAKLPIAKSKGTIVIGLRNSGAALLAVGLSLSAVGPAAASASQSPVQEAPAELNVLSAILESAIRDRTQQMVVGSGLEGAEQANMLLFSAKSKDTIAAEHRELKARKERLAGYGQGYSKIETNFESERFEIKGDKARAEVTERTEMTYTTGGPPESYKYEQIIEFSKTGSGWTIDHISPKYPEGIPPSTVVSAEQLSHAKAAPGSSAALRLNSGQVATPAKGQVANKRAPQNSATPGLKETGQEVSRAVSYNYTAMVNYARSWVFGRNGAYRQFGNDCQNFVSQSLNAGGWQHVGGWYQYDTSWWYSWANQTWSWTGAQHFHNFAVSQGRVTYLNDLGPADVLQVHWPEGTPDVDHSMIVTYSPWSAGTRDIRVSYHTTDTLDRSIWNLYSSFPYATWYALRT